MNKIEILSPAGSMDSVIAAVRSGADAIYVGSKRFSARSGAHNFDDEELRECVRYCHERDVKVYLALNTLIFDDEMKDALELAKAAARADIDAIIIQDIGLAALIKKAIPDLPLHASTQMSAHTSFGAKALYEMGYKRVVLARELSIEEIRQIHEDCPGIELEVFVHGALCCCVSGQCYFSAMVGGRSANRGRCAQPCRLPMRFGDNDHALSLKDNGGIDDIRALEKIGAASAKIEGRMKRPEYVAAATAAAVKMRDDGELDRHTRARLESAFSRSGFTDGYLRGKTGSGMFGFRTKQDVLAADEGLLREIRNEYRKEYQRIPINMAVRITVGEKPLLTVTDGSHTVTAQGDTPAEKAVNRPLTGETVKNSLNKTGGTPYYVDEWDIRVGEGAALSASALNALRREALEKLGEERRKPRHHYTINDFDIDDEINKETNDFEAVDWVCSPNPELPDELKGKGIVFIPPEGLKDTEKVRRMLADGWRLGIEMPRVFFSEEPDRELMNRLMFAGVKDVLVHTLDAAYRVRSQFPSLCLHAGFGMNLANSRSLKWAKDYGFRSAEISVELDVKRIEKLKKCIPVGMIRYGYFPLMVTRNTPGGLDVSCKTESFLQDRRNEKFRVVPHDGYTEILNCVPVFLPQEKYNADGRVFHIIRFTVENSVDNKENILAKLRENSSFERFTHGLYLRGVK